MQPLKSTSSFYRIDVAKLLDNWPLASSLQVLGVPQRRGLPVHMYSVALYRDMYCMYSTAPLLRALTDCHLSSV